VRVAREYALRRDEQGRPVRRGIASPAGADGADGTAGAIGAIGAIGGGGGGGGAAGHGAVFRSGAHVT
jgi:hypothetical protein